MPKMDWASSVRPAPTSPARPTISPARSVEVHVPELPVAGEPRTSSTVSPGLLSLRAKSSWSGPADHEPDELFGVELGGRSGLDVVAVPQHGDAVGDLEDLLEPVGDVDDPDAFRGRAPR